ncbi:MAG TPA: 2Fe-2S iron-sulfur cluster-binding protein [Anaeromyxobacter sp.]|nr:2Fe-2S iron-sulfur cluster-binding protein [Anaeromyxobacter sp.]
MPRVTFVPADRSVEVPRGTSIHDAADAAGVDLPSNCGGVCACTTCHVWIEEGQGGLSDIEDREDDKLQEAAGLSAHSRLGCQARIGEEDVVVRIPGNRIKA